MLDINSLRLTDEELSGVLTAGYKAMHLDGRTAADTQLAKVLWGMQKWLEEEPWGGSCCAADALHDQLLAAGMVKPEGD